MPPMKPWIPVETLQSAADLDFGDQLRDGLAQIQFTSALPAALDGIKSIASTFQPLPIVVSERPEVAPLGSPVSLPESESRASQTTPPAGVAPAQPSAIPGPDLSPDSGTPVRSAAEMSADMPLGEIDNSSRETFVRTAYPHALRAADGDPQLAQQLIATAISEHGGVGTGRDLRELGFNVGGIQGVEGPAGSFTALDAGRPRQFAAYNNLGEGFRAVRDLVSGGRYAEAAENYRQTGDVDRYWREINAAGYSETPDWQDRIASIRRDQVAPLIGQQPAARPAPTTPPQAEQTPAAQAQVSSDIAQSALDDPDKWALCGPVAAVIAAGRRGGKWSVAEAKRIAQEQNLWDPDQGMHGLESQATLLRQMGYAAKTGAADLDTLAREAATGNTPIISTNKHYFILTGYDPKTGKFDTSTTGGALKAGQQHLTLDEIASLGNGIQGAAYFDNPTSQTPSVAATAPNAGATPPAASLPSAPTAATGAPEPSPSVGATTAQIGSGPESYANLLTMGKDQPEDTAPGDGGYVDPDQGPRESGYTVPEGLILGGSGPQAGGYAPLAAAEGAPSSLQTTSAIPSSDEELAPRSLEERPVYGPAEVPATPAIGAVQSARAGLGIDDQPAAPAVPYGQVQSTQGEPDYVRPRGTFEPTSTERRRFDDAINQISTPLPEGNIPFTNTPASPGLRAAGGAGLGALQVLSTASDYVSGRLDNIQVPALARSGIVETDLSGADRERARYLLALSAEGDRQGVELMTPEERQELTELVGWVEQRYQQIKDSPDQITEYAQSAPGSILVPLALGIVTSQSVGPTAARVAGSAARAAGAGARTARAAGYAADVAAQSAIDPTNVVGQPAADALGQGVKGAYRGARALPGAFEQGAEAVQGAVRRGGELLEQGRATARELNAQPQGAGTYGILGPVPSGETRIPRAGYADDLSEGAEALVRNASERNAPQEVVRRAEVAERAQRLLGLEPEQVRAWQNQAITEAPYTRAVRGEALRSAEYADAERVDVAMTRLEAAMTRVRDVGNGLEMAPADRLETADALLEAAQAAAAFGRSAAASTAEGRATARALGQRRNAILARQAYETSQRARQVGTDARFAAQAVMQAANRGQITPEGIQRLRTLRDKLLEAERNGLAGDGTGGRLVAMEQPSTRASSTVGPVAGRRGPGVLARAATDVGNAAFGSIVGGTAGYMAPADTEEERLRNAQIGVGLGAVGYPIVGRAMRRGRGALATFGPAPSPGAPNRSIAVGSDPSRRYEFRYRVADLRDLVPSNLPNGAPNPAFPKELQPRSRERVASQLQIDQIAQGLEPDALLNDVGRLDSGPMIVGADNIVESGNGRTLALQRAASQYPEQYSRYVESLKGQIGQYGLADDALEGVQLPVLVRERVSDVDRAAFAAEANNSGILRMSSVEQATQDAGNLSDDVVANLAVAENDTIATALRKTDNRDLVRQWVGTLPENERASVLDADGNLSAQGYERLTNAMLMRTYGQGAGERLARAFIESADPTVRNVQTALMVSLPDMARAEALIRAGQRSGDLSIAEDVATAVDMLARLKRDGIPVREYLGQAAMFERELTPMQEDMLRFLDQHQRRPATIRESLREYASRVENSADPNQGDMFGGEVASASKEEMWRGSTATIEREATAAAEARAATRRARANDSGLAAADPESLAPVEDIIPGTAGPEGRLAQEGAPTPLRPAGLAPADPNILPGGGPEGRLSVEGAPPEPANLSPVDPRLAPAGGPESSLTLASGRTIKDVVGQIDEVLANPNAPGAVERLRALHDDLQEISTQGFRRSSDIRRRLQRNGLLRAGLAARSDDVEPLVRALTNVDPDRPEEMQAVLKIISKPRLIDRLLEYQYVNMLSSPITQAINISSNTMQIAGRLLLQNPLEFAFSGGQSTGVGAAFQGAARGFREGLGEAGQIMRTGTSSEQVNRATEIGDYSHVNREALTEKFGKAGALLHVISTRPLAAMDALLGHVAYAGAAEQYAQRTADQLLRNKAPEVAGMSREAARRHVMANIWDYPSIVERAGKIEDYTLLRSKDTQGNNWGRVERALRQAASLRNPSEDAGFAGQATAFLANQVLPFFNVPLNFAKQGAERTAGVPVNAVRAIRSYGRGDVERGAELAAKATIGAGTLATGIVLAAGDNLTDDGPEDAGQRAIWELTHKRNSYRVPGTDQWISWEGTPFAIPFGMVAGARRGWTEANERAAKKGETDLVDVVGSAALKTAQGGAEGFFSQSFIRGLADQYKLLTGQDTGLSTVAAQGANTVSRFIPASGMVNFFARIADDVERDAGKPQATSDLPENIGARVASRLPGTRQQVDPKLGPYGQPVPNEQGGVYGAIPYYRGEGSMAGDPITRRLEAAHVGAPPPATEITFRGMTIPLTMRDQRVFRQAWGQAFRRELEGMEKNGKEYPPEAYQKARSLARDEAEGVILEQIGSAEIRRRVEGRQAVGAR